MSEPTESAVQALDSDDLYVDAADRLERVIDTQIATLDSIDTKAEHVTRLVAVLLGVVLTLVSVSFRIDGFDAGTVPLPVTLVVIAGVSCFVASMASAIVTYLSSEYKTGLHQNVGHVLSHPEYETTGEQYIRRVLGTYGYAIERNKRIVEANSNRFRWTLAFLLVGISLLTAGTTMALGGIRGAGAWVAILTTTSAVGLVGWYVLTERYLTLDGQRETND